MSNNKLNIPVPLRKGDLTVLGWYAAWTPEVHKAHWSVRRSWPPGFRYMEDLSLPGFSNREQTVQRAEERMQAGPLLKGDTVQKRSKAKDALSHLLTYRLVEGSYTGGCRLTARGRAALKVNGLDCPEVFKSHCPKIFDDHSLLPVNGHNVRIDFDDRSMGRLGDAYQVKHGEELPDDKTTWDLMLREYSEDSYRGSGTLTGASARLGVVTGSRYLNGSLREHHQFVSLTVQSERDHQEVLRCSLSMEGLADLLVSNHNVPVTIDHYTGQDGMSRSEPAPPPVSVSRRMRERIKRGNQDIQNRVKMAMVLIENAKMGKRAQAEILDVLGLVARDVPTHGAFAAKQAMEEVSSVAESMMTVMAEKVQLSGQGPAGLLLGGQEPTPTLLLEGSGEENI